MRIAVGSDERTHLTDAVVADLTGRGHEVVLFGALADAKRRREDAADWPMVSRQVAQAVAGGHCREGVLFCWTGTGASIAANKVSGIRAALCQDAETARGARTWNHANILVLSLRSVAEGIASEILEAWFTTPWGDREWDLQQVARIAEMEQPMRDAREGPTETLPVLVYTALNHLEADVVRGLLVSEGIPATLQYESVGLVYGLTIDGMGETRVYVPEQLEGRARQIIAEQCETNADNLGDAGDGSDGSAGGDWGDAGR